MNKSTLVGIVLGVTAATAIAGYASYTVIDGAADAPGAQQTCYEVAVETPAEPTDKKRVTGTVIGALIGGAVGRDVGDRDITTAAGAAAGAYAGNQIQKKAQEHDTAVTTEVRCEPS